MPNTYEVKSGDTLSAIASRLGVPINQIKGYRSGDPNLIYPGEKLTVGDAPQLGGLGGTLATGDAPPATGATGGTQKELPTTQPDNLSIFRNLLKSVSEKYGKTSSATGLEAGMGALGVSPEQISGRSLSSIVDFVKGQTTPGIADIYQSSVDLLESSRVSAERQLTMLINTGGITRLDDMQVAQYSSMSGMDYGYLIATRDAMKAEEAKPTSFSVVTKGGRNVRMGFDDMGKIVSETDIGAAEAEALPMSYREWQLAGKPGTYQDWVKKGSEDTFEWKNLSQAVKEDIVEWMTQKEGYETSWLKQLDEDPDFAAYTVSGYYQR